MNISTSLKIESDKNYSFVNIVLHLGKLTLGDEDSFEIKGTVLIGLHEVIENIELLINHDTYNGEEIILENLNDLNLEEYLFSRHDLLPRGSNLFDGDQLLVFKVKNDKFIALCKPYNKETTTIHDFPINLYFSSISDLIKKINKATPTTS